MESDPDLRAKLEAFELDEADASFPFTSRLAREQGWTHAEAARSIREYKRFVYLAMTAGHPVTPSETVDHVWHLHLIYTRSYWQRMCRDLLGRDLHHEPTQGGRSEGAKFEDWYSRTLDSYRRLLGEEPPQDIWPAPQDRFAPSQGCWIDRKQFWLIRRPWPWNRRTRKKSPSTSA